MSGAVTAVAVSSVAALASGSVGVGALALGAAGTLIGAEGAMNSAKAQEANARYQAQVAANDQTIADQNAAYASQAGAASVTANQLKERQQVSAVTADLAANGVDTNSGSAADVRKAMTTAGQLNTEQVAQDAALQVYGYKTQASNFAAQAGLDLQEARQAPIAGDLAAGGTLLSGLGGVASKWASWSNASGSSGDGGYLDSGTF